MIILGIDPGLAETGWGIIRMANSKWQIANSGKKKSKRNNGLKLVGYGCIKTPVGHDLSRRLLILKNELQKVIIEHKPDCLVLEQLFFGRNAKTAMIVGLARGVLMVTSAEQNVPVFEYQGLRVKLNLSGNGHSSKSQMQKVVKKILRLELVPKPQHAADALAMAIYHATAKKREG